jgi:tetratricopeptide (TPR) repeat protein
MQDKRCKDILIIVMGALVMLTGCASWTAAPQSGAGPAAPAPPPNSYYYYTEAQILRNSGDNLGALKMMQRAMELDPGAIFIRRELATLYLQTNNVDQALDLLLGIQKDDPGDVPTLLILGRIYQNRKEMDQAKAVYEEVLDQDPDQEDVYLLLGNLYMNDQQYDEAFDIFQRMTERFPGAYAGFFFIGKIQRERGHNDKAEQAFLQSLAIEPKLEGARYELIGIYEQRPDNASTRRKIIDQYQAILEEDPENPQATFGLALYFHKIGKPQQAAELIRDLADTTSENDLVRPIYRLYLESGRNADAVYLLEEILKTHPDFTNLQYLLGLAYHNLENNAQAMVHFQAVSQDSQFYRDAVIQQAFYYSDDGQVDKAIGILETALVHDPDHPDFLVYLASMYEEKKAYDKALALLKHAIEVDPENERAYFRLGVVYDKLDRKEDSIAAMKQVLVLKPDHANALNYLAYTYADLGIHLDEAEELVQKALTLKPDDGYITDSLGWVYYKQGRYKEALTYLLKASELVEDDPIILEHVGDAYRELGQNEKALEFYRKSLKYRETDKDAIMEKINLLEQPSS